MRQPNNQDGRNCWGSARERNRLRARFHIRERVAHGETNILKPSNVEIVDPSVIADYIKYIQTGDRSKFSLSKLDRNFELVSSQLPVSILQHVLPEFERTLLEYSVHLCTAWFGLDYAQAFQTYIQSLQSFTIMEYAAWMGKYSIVAGLLVAGVNPCLRGEHPQKPMDDGMTELGGRVLKRFFDCFPVLLSTYIVKRVVELRRDAWEASDVDVTCPCGEHPGLYFRSCQHHICEFCFWEDLLANIDQRGECEDVVVCLCCDIDRQDNHTMLDCNEATSHHQRKATSLSKFHALPMDRQALLKLSTGKKKKKINEQEQWVKSWTAAVLPSLGSTQSVRRDKFRSFIERQSLHYVRGCLYAGVDIDEINEYGQTALYISTWRGDYDITRLLLEFGADPNIVAHDGTGPLEVASLLGHESIRDLLSTSIESMALPRVSEPFPRPQSQQSVVMLSILIPRTVDHPGAGSYTIDNSLSHDQVDWLIDLHRRIPVDITQKKKAGLCSERSYFCDAIGHIQRALEAAITHAGLNCDTIQVFPHMRFLDYSIVGTTLNPHVDICRVDPRTGVRSSHTFIVYLNDCVEGGETCLLQDMSHSSEILARVAPKRGRLLLFPHNCPHEGKEVRTVPKLLVRGEVYLSMADQLGT